MILLHHSAIRSFLDVGGATRWTSSSRIIVPFIHFCSETSKIEKFTVVLSRFLKIENKNL